MRMFCFVLAALALSIGQTAAEDSAPAKYPVVYSPARTPIGDNLFRRKVRYRYACTSLGDECTTYSECCPDEATGCGWVAGCPAGKKCCY
jgi:hypothetical protein